MITLDWRHMRSAHSTSFPNPTIVEALCEFQFSCLDAQNNWDGKWYGRLHSKLGESYDMEPKTAKGIIIQNSNYGASTLSENLISINQMIYKHKTKEKLIQIAPWILTINEIGHYTGWNSFLDHIEYAWTALASVITPVQIKRIGMRYINRIPRTSANESVGDWINKNDIFPNRLLIQNKDFFFRCEIPYNAIRIIVTVTEEQTNVAIKPIIFDIDTFMVKQHDNIWSDIKKTLSSLHSVIRKEFDVSQTERLQAYLRESSEMIKGV